MGFFSKLMGSSSSNTSAPVTSSSNYEDARVGVSDQGQAVGAGGVGAKDNATVLGQGSNMGQTVIDLDGGSTGSIVTNDPSTALASISAIKDSTRIALNSNIQASSKALDEAYNATRWQQNFSTEQQKYAEQTVQKAVDSVKELALPASERGLGNIATLSAAVLIAWFIFKK